MENESTTTNPTSSTGIFSSLLSLGLGILDTTLTVVSSGDTATPPPTPKRKN
jgi:hypothetical protein